MSATKPALTPEEWANGGDTIASIMAPVVADMWRAQIALFRRLIEAGPHGAEP